MSGTRLGIALVGLVSLATAGCENGDICPSEVVVLIVSPADGANVMEDRSSDEGIQVNVAARSNLGEGDACTLTVTDSEGEKTTTSATSDAVGDVVFEEVTLPQGTVTLALDGASKDCGSGSDEIEVNVVGAVPCTLSVREGLLESGFYETPVLNSTNDSDDDTPNFQAHIDVATLPNFDVELWVTGTSEFSAGTVMADAGGRATYAISLGQGQLALRATCTSPRALARAESGSVVVFVDTMAPACSLLPAEGTTITPAMDRDSNTANGTQILLRGHAESGDDHDVEGAGAAFRVDTTNLVTPNLDANGDTEVEATFDVASGTSVSVRFRAEDRAGNACVLNRDYLYVTGE